MYPSSTVQYGTVPHGTPTGTGTVQRVHGYEHVRTARAVRTYIILYASPSMSSVPEWLYRTYLLYVCCISTVPYRSGIEGISEKVEWWTMRSFSTSACSTSSFRGFDRQFLSEKSPRSCFDTDLVHRHGGKAPAPQGKWAMQNLSPMVDRSKEQSN